MDEEYHVWIRSRQEKLFVYYENQSAIHLAKNSTYHSHSNHIDIRYHWIRKALDNGLLKLEKVHTNDNWSNMLIKTIPVKKHLIW